MENIQTWTSLLSTKERMMKQRHKYLTISLICFALCFGVAYYAQAAWLFAICTMEGGQPKIDTTITPVHGWVLSGQLGQYGAYLFSGKVAQLGALDALPNVLGIVAVTIKDVIDPNTGVMTKDVRWIELDDSLPADVRTKLNTWLTNHDKPTIPSGWTNKRAIRVLFRHLRPDWEWEQDWVKDE